MMRPLVKLTSSRSCVISSQPACRSEGVMNFVQISRSLSCFLFMPKELLPVGTNRPLVYLVWLQGGRGFPDNLADASPSLYKRGVRDGHMEIHAMKTKHLIVGAALAVAAVQPGYAH